jgi:hypothetical protein
LLRILQIAITHRKIAGVICTTIAGVNATFFAEYKFPNQNDEPHIFTPIHKWVQTQKTRWLAENKQQSFDAEAHTSTADIAAVPQLSSNPNNNHHNNISELRRIAKGHQ